MRGSQNNYSLAVAVDNNHSVAKNVGMMLIDSSTYPREAMGISNPSCRYFCDQFVTLGDGGRGQWVGRKVLNVDGASLVGVKKKIFFAALVEFRVTVSKGAGQ